MKTAGVAIDDWKLPIFRKHLDSAGYAYTEHAGLTEGTSMLKVKCEWIAALRPVIEAADGECARLKK